MQPSSPSSRSIWLWLFIGLSLVHTASHFWPGHWLAPVTKPFLVPLLIVYVLSSGSYAGRNLLIAALSFSTIGDIVLIFQQEHFLFFVGGLVSFLLGHVFYAFIFVKALRAAKTSEQKSGWWLSLPVMLYLGGFLYFLVPAAEALAIPVVVYALVIATMLLLSLLLYRAHRHPATLLILLGATLFVASDSILAVNKFLHAFELSGVAIMATYLSAQGLLTVGVISLLQKR